MAMDIEDQKVLYHISRVVELQTVKLDSMQKEIHLVNMDIQSIKSGNCIVTPKDSQNIAIKQASVGGGIGAALVTIATYLLNTFIKS